MIVFSRVELIRFQHCDPAGIVFYPRYAEMINATVEDWFDHIGIGFAEIHGPMNAAIPVVSLKIDFKRPTRLGERLILTLAIEHLGATSIRLAVDAALGEEIRFQSKLTLVHISRTDYRPRPWPVAFRRGFQLKAE